MKINIQDMKVEVQEALDELFGEHLIPFRLTAQKVNADGPEEYEVPFYDSRIRSMRFSWKDGGSRFKDVVRSAVLDRAKKYGGPH